MLKKEGGFKSSSFKFLPQNSELEKEEESYLEYYSTFEANTIDAHHDALGNDEDNNCDDESYVDDYLKMMKD